MLSAALITACIPVLFSHIAMCAESMLLTASIVSGLRPYLGVRGTEFSKWRKYVPNHFLQNAEFCRVFIRKSAAKMPNNMRKYSPKLSIGLRHQLDTD